MNVKNRVFFANLDSLRFLAFFAVFISHIRIQTNHSFSDYINHKLGSIGVNLFFVISGFLITYLLFYEKNNFLKVDVKSFFIRRLLRIWPLYFFIIILEILYYFYSHNTTIDKNFSYYPLFLGNFDRIFNDVKTTSSFIDLNVLWSIAVEEQFYIIIPFIFIIFKKNRSIFKSLLFFHVISIISKILILHFVRNFEYSYRLIQFNPISAFNMISMGSMMAYISCQEYNFLNKIKEYNSKNLILFCTLIIVLALRLDFITNNIYMSEIIVNELISIAFALIIFFTCFSEKKYNKESSSMIKVMNYLGKISYGLYIYHVIVIYFVSKILRESIPIIFLSFGITIIISIISFKFIEKPILDLKKKYTKINTR